YQGGLNVPMFVSGSGVIRKGVTDSALVHVMDVYATILDVLGANLPGGVNNSFSFADRLQNDGAPSRPYLLSEIKNDTGQGYAIRNDHFKLIQQPTGETEMFDVLADPFELNDLHAGGLTAQEEDVKAELMAEAELQFSGWSCNDGIQNGVETATSCATTTSIEEDTFPGIQYGTSAYPNPTTGSVKLQAATAGLYSEKEADVAVYTVSGQKVLGFQAVIRSGVIEIDLSRLSSGTYVIQITSPSSTMPPESILISKI
ncbi:T9SS type A sorting domain-containing protein, partial [bacterium]|nr:T9SS type A sorting domain-containing protein [bacterium]